MNKKFKLLTFLIAIFIFCFVCGCGSKKTEEVTYGNTISRINADGYLASDNENIYYSYLGNRILKISKTDYTKVEELATGSNIANLLVDDTKVYYINNGSQVRSMNKDGSENALLTTGFDLLVKIDDKLYFTNAYYKLVNSSLDGKVVTVVDDYDLRDMQFDGEYFYGLSKNSNYKIIKVKYDGSDSKPLFDSDMEFYRIKYTKDALLLGVQKNEEGEDENTVYISNVDGSSLKKIYDASLSLWSEEKNGLFYENLGTSSTRSYVKIDLIKKTAEKISKTEENKDIYDEAHIYTVGQTIDNDMFYVNDKMTLSHYVIKSKKSTEIWKP